MELAVKEVLTEEYHFAEELSFTTQEVANLEEEIEKYKLIL